MIGRRGPRKGRMPLKRQACPACGRSVVQYECGHLADHKHPAGRCVGSGIPLTLDGGRPAGAAGATYDAALRSDGPDWDVTPDGR